MSRTLILVIIVIAQFAGVSLWFAANAVIHDIAGNTSIGWLTSMVQLGFIAGTFTFAFLSIADRYSPSKVFFFSALLGSACNALMLFVSDDIPLLYASRLLTGFFIAGIYPVGMKITADYFDKDISKALGFLLGALVLGTAFPFLLKSGVIRFEWSTVIIATSLFAFAGGLLVLWLIPDGPFRKKAAGFNPSKLVSIFQNKNLKNAAFGYFGHMWELYAFWAFLPLAVQYSENLAYQDLAMPLMVEYKSFGIIAIGAIGCVLGGFVALRIGNPRVAMFALVCSGLCCLLSPYFIQAYPVVMMGFFLFWGFTVIMDSPQFSSMVSLYAPQENKGTALTFINCIGFSITILSIQLLDWLSNVMDTRWIFLFLFPGPVLGVMALWPLAKRNPAAKNSIP